MNKEATIGKIHSFESFGTVDGPGLRFVVFMQGCAFRCLYCHNPDAFDMNQASYELTPKEVYQRMQRFKPYYKRGGITLSGGEPLLQPKFVAELFQRCKAEGIHTTIDTAGMTLSDEVKNALNYTDLVLLDIKCMDPQIHISLTGKPLEPTLTFAGYLAQKGIPTWIRYVLVPGITDDEELIKKHAEFVAGLSNVEKVEVLPFHKLGESKYENLGLTYTLKDVKPPTLEQIENAKSIYRRKGIKVN
jgi:pyruvate formate lyase activating enzyme